MSRAHWPRAKWPRICKACGMLNSCTIKACVRCQSALVRARRDDPYEVRRRAKSAAKRQPSGPPAAILIARAALQEARTLVPIRAPCTNPGK